MNYRQSRRNNKTVWYYLKIYFVALFVCLIVFAGGSYYKFQTLCANSATCKSDLSINIDNDAVGYFQGRKIIPPRVDLAMGNPQTQVLGVNASNEEKHIYIDLSAQKLYAYEGDVKIQESLISSGKWGRTPVGNFNIWQKLPVTRMAGGQGQDAYDLPNVQWVMYFHNDFGLHTAYWHNNFGHPMSHGCVNMRLVDAKKLFDWADGPTKNKLGTAVSVCSEFKMPGTCVQDKILN